MKVEIEFEPVLLGGDANTYGMARSFFEEYGTPSHVICKGAFHICQHSKIITIDVVEPRLEDDEVFVSTLINYARTYTKPLVLVPCGDNYTKLLVRNQDALREAFLFSVVTPEQFGLLSTKERFYETCKRFELAFPETCEVTSKTASTFTPPFSYPVIVKPSNSVAYWNCSYPGKKKAFVVRNAQELEQVFAGVYSSDYDDALIVQDFIPGDDTRMRVVNTYSSQDGVVRMMALGDVVLEEHTPLGIGSYGAIMTGFNETILKNIRGFLEAIGYVGYANFDLKYDERDATYKLLEINPRQGRSSFFVTASGKNLARYLVRDVVEGANQECEVATLADEVLWTMVPLDVIKRYTFDEVTRKRIERLIAEKKVVQSYWYESDRSFLRWLNFRVNQHNYRSQYKTHFGKRHVND